MAYSIIEFCNGEVGVVSAKWLTPDKREVFWPPYKDTYTFNKSLQRQEEANENVWALYPIKRALYSTDDLDRALQKQKTAVVTSTLETDEEGDDFYHKRERKRPRRFSSSSSETKIQESKVKRPPRIKLPKKQLNFSQNSKTDCDLEHEELLPLTPFDRDVSSRNGAPSKRLEHFTSSQLRENDESLSTAIIREKCSSTEAPSKRLEHFTSSQLGENDESLSTAIIREKCSNTKALSKRLEHFTSPQLRENDETPSTAIIREKCSSTEENRRIIELLLTLKEQNTQILAYIRSKRGEAEEDSVYQNANKFPMRSVDEIKRFDSDLEDTNKNALIQHLSSLGGEGVVARTNRILKELMTDNIATQFNFCGQNKNAFNSLQLKDIVIQTVKKKCKEATTWEVEQAIKNWLKHAPQRVKSARKKEQRRMEAIENA